MSDKVKTPDWLAMSSVLENLGWKLSRLGPGLKGTVCSSRGPALTSNTCTQTITKTVAHAAAVVCSVMHMIITVVHVAAVYVQKFVCSRMCAAEYTQQNMCSGQGPALTSKACIQAT